MVRSWGMLSALFPQFSFLGHQRCSIFQPRVDRQGSRTLGWKTQPHLGLKKNVHSKSRSWAELTLFLIASIAVAETPREGDYYKMITLPVPSEIALEVGGMDWLDAEKNRLLICTRRGDVWLVDNPYADAPRLANGDGAVNADTKQVITYKRFARGLHEPLGLLRHKDGIYIAQRAELTRLQDTNGDDRADVFKTVCDQWETSGNYHEYAFGPKLDGKGFMWVTLNRSFGGEPEGRAHWRGWAVKIDPQGKMYPVCPGLRSPAGLGANVAGDMFYTENQGDWVAACRLSHLKTGSFQGNPFSLRSCDHPESPLKNPGNPPNGVNLEEAVKRMPSLMLPAVWFPYPRMGRSSSDVVYDDADGKFGPFKHQIFVGDQSTSIIIRIFLEQVDGEYQGACFPFREGFQCGVMRMCLGKDGSMFVGQTNRGWGSRGGKPYGLQRLVWTGKTPFEIHEMRATADGFELTFTRPVDLKTAGDVKSYSMKCWTYNHHSGYGCRPINTHNLSVKSAMVNSDGRSVRLIVDGLAIAYVHELRLPGVRDRDGNPLLHPEAYYTLNRIPQYALTVPPIARTLRAGEPLIFSGIRYRSEDKNAAVEARLMVRPEGEKEFLNIKLEHEEDGTFKGALTGEHTKGIFAYYVEVKEEGQESVTFPEEGPKQPMKIVPDIRAPLIPGSPEIVSARNYAITIRWPEGKDDTGIEGYRMYRSGEKAGAAQKENLLKKLPSGQREFRDTSMPSAKVVWYAVQPIDLVGREGQPIFLKVEVPADEPPQNTIKLTALATDKVFLRWQGAIESDVERLFIERAADDGKFEPIANYVIGGKLKMGRHIDEKVEKDIHYRYRLRLRDRGGNQSEPGPEVKVMAGAYLRRINCGGREVIGEDGIPWEADKGRRDGMGTWASRSKIKKAPNDLQGIYQTERWSNRSIIYTFDDLQPGSYSVRLLFAETNLRFSKVGKRTFDIKINDHLVRQKVDVFARVGANTAWDVEETVEISVRQMKILLQKVKIGPMLKGIEIRAIVKR